MTPPLATGKGLPPLSDFDQRCISAEAICRDAQAKYDREQIEAKIAALQARPPSDTRYKEAQTAIARYEDNLLLLRCAELLEALGEDMRIAREYIIEQDERLALVEGAVKLGATVGASFRDKQAGVSPKTAEAPLQSDSHTSDSTQ